MVPLRPVTMHTFPAAHPSTQRPRPSFPPRRPSCRVFAGGARGGSPPTPARSGSRRRARSVGPRGGPAPENVTEEGVSSRATVREFLRSVFRGPGSGRCVSHISTVRRTAGEDMRTAGGAPLNARTAMRCRARHCGGGILAVLAPKNRGCRATGRGRGNRGQRRRRCACRRRRRRPGRRVGTGRRRTASDGVGRCPTVFPRPLPRMRARYVDDFGHSDDGPEHIGQAEVRVRHRRAERRRARQSGSNSGRGREPRGRGAGGFPSGEADDFGHRRAHNSPERAS